MEDRNTETKDIEQGMVMAADVTDRILLGCRL